MKPIRIIVALATLLLSSETLLAQPGDAKSGVDRLYNLDCGQARAGDMSRWTPGENINTPMDVVDNCYLIHHSRDGYLLWDTGIADAVAAMPDGLAPAQAGAPHWRRTKTLAGQIAALGVKPADIKYVAISHTHPDHVGNVELYPQSTLLVQKAEYEWPLPNGGARFNAAHPVKKLEGDYDVFGDGSVTILSTPGHTPGHQSLLVRLPKTGAIVLSGDAVHFKDNWDKRRVPAGNTDKDKTLASMQRLADLMAKEKAQLWINHDRAQSDTLKHAPDFYE
jgi:glyoxylase-like metal-dependent hydrolase (beta-lactamase superfamily II)